ncbi:MAG: hypothetical protein Q7T55_17175 [Solirubrobacteraceae bacterium]|nr:hypothetical protein [Solirubrobacteraceae bacterium]
MTTDPFDDLERQLRSRVREQRGSAPGPARGRRRLLRRTPLLAIAAAGLTLSGGALAATSLTRPGDKDRGERISFRAQEETRTRPVCRAMTAPRTDTKLVYTDAAVLPAVQTALPWITAPASAREARMTRQLLRTFRTDGPLVRGTSHALDMGGGRWVLVYVQQGRGWFGAVRDPDACSALREARVRELAGERPGVLRAALRGLAAAVDVAPDVQKLAVMTTFGPCRPGGPRCGGGGTSMSFWPGAVRSWNRKVPYGLLGSIGPRYTGLASPRADHLTITGRRPERLAGVPHRITPERGFWVLDLPRGSGAVRVTERTADGTVLRVIAIRGHYRS